MSALWYTAQSKSNPNPFVVMNAREVQRKPRSCDMRMTRAMFWKTPVLLCKKTSPAHRTSDGGKRACVMVKIARNRIDYRIISSLDLYQRFGEWRGIRL
jgi:hypothetical protein